MHKYIVPHPWKIIESSFDPMWHPNTESLCSIGNGRLGQRANLEETYSGESLEGSYVAGVYYPDKTRVGWWKNGYPEYFAKVLNSVQWHTVKLSVNDIDVDLAQATITSWNRECDMQEGILRKKVIIEEQGATIQIESERFYSIVEQDIAALRYKASVLSGSASIGLSSVLHSDVRNSDANYDEDFWHKREGGDNWLSATTRKTEFTVAAAIINRCVSVNPGQTSTSNKTTKDRLEEFFSTTLSEGQSIQLEKYVCIDSSRYTNSDNLPKHVQTRVTDAADKGYRKLKGDHIRAWEKRWEQNDITISGDIEAQQGIRFNIFQLYQTYDGSDDRLNIGPKGFTGEKYGGSTYWDTEAYCLPFYMCTTSQEVARNLLVYRYHHLPKAIENAEKLGFTNGAALYPMVTMNGEECHNEWEITFEEIHRNGAIAFAIFNYIRYTGDSNYLLECGLEVLIGIARFWAQRVNWSSDKEMYVMLGVTGPNEYENNVNNNWYSSYIAKWCLEYTLESLSHVKKSNSNKYSEIVAITQFDIEVETKKWQSIIENLYLPKDEERGIYLQQDGFLDKEDLQVKDLTDADRPINQKWSWDRILRSPFIKQADVLQGLYFFESDFDLEDIRSNFLYYEPKTVHESSLSPCVHAILAASLGMKEKAYEMYVRTARLDLDNYNNDTEDGCHITSMAGTWMSIVEGFAGMRMRNGQLQFDPFLPTPWKDYTFKIMYQKQLLEVVVSDIKVTLRNHGIASVEVSVRNQRIHLAPKKEEIVVLD